MINKISILFLLVILVALMGCPISGGGGSDSEETTTEPAIDAPGVTTPTPDGGGGTTPTPEEVPVVSDLVASKSGMNIELNWSYSSSFDSFAIYRKVGELTPVEIISGLTDHTYSDSTVPYDSDITYSIYVKHKGNLSKVSNSTNIIRVNREDIKVSEVKASILEFSDKIRLTWKPVRGATSYKVYRYKNRDGAYESVITTELCELNDVTVLKDTAYYYKVLWVYNSVEYGDVESRIFGLYSDTIDIYEPNDNITKIENELGSTIFDNTKSALIYSFKNGKKDIDYYKYSGSQEYLKVIINLEPANSSGLIKVQVIHNNTVKKEQTITSGKNIITFNSYGDLLSTDQVYIKVYSESISEFFFAKYKVNITIGM